MANLRERLHSARDWGVAIEELEREVEQIADARERSEVLYELGALSEEVFPERERALAIYQRAWRMFPDNIKALVRAREVYHELGRLEMVAKLGQLELKVASGDEAAELAAMVGEALLDCRAKDQAVAMLQQALAANPDSLRVKDALAAASYDPQGWQDIVDTLSAQAQDADSTTAARILLRAARITHLETPQADGYEELLSSALSNDPQSDNANFLYESLLAQQERWDDLEKHQNSRGYAAVDDAARARLYQRFALEWVQRFGDRERGARFFIKALRAAAENGESGIKTTVAAFTLIEEVQGAKSDW